jgi:putative acetyltransferase
MIISSPLAMAPIDPEDPAALRLLALSDVYLQSLYPTESNHLESAAALKRPGVTFLGGSVDGEIVACGAARILEDDGRYAEIKRLFVRPQ